ncbi:pyridoxal phosphate-dependent aminotransferase [Desulfovibrio sp. OttesenSCG-928-C06]|nr:pyridoxal phosphate-dependent aminotransferase [Desulfovibrio sp. OttesenSCG-928-C06]
MQLANRVSQLKPSATLAVNTLAQELKAAGREVISLSVGEPDFDTPEHISQAAIEAIKSGFTRYTAVPGITELRQAAADYFNRYGAGAKVENVIISNGGKQCLYNLFQSIIDPGDEVLVPAPYWVSYPPLVELAGGSAAVVPAGVDKGFKVSVEDLERHRTPKTKACIMNSPSNPTGAVYTRQELDAIAEWAVANKVMLVADEIYDQLVYEPEVHSSLCAWWNKHPEYFTVINGVAKSYAMTGWRVGYTLVHPDLIKACNKLQSQSSSNICSISQKAALAALTGDQTCLAPMKEAFVRRRNLVMDIISSWPDVKCPTPGGAFYVFPDMSAHYNAAMPDSTSMCKFLLDKAGVALVPGEAFGDDNCIRLSYATADSTLQKALELVGKALFNK